MRRDTAYLAVIALLLSGAFFSGVIAEDPGTWALVTDTRDDKQFVQDDAGDWEIATDTDTETHFTRIADEPDDTTGVCGEPIDRWHGAVIDGCEAGHEHGDPAPQWADDWSMEHFGHPVIYGGDEATPGENDHKHEGFKGFTYRYIADDDSTVDLHVRLHAQSNPHGRSGRWHSYEIYARDETGAVSMWQGWLDFGVVTSERFGFDTHTIAEAREESSNYIISSPEGYDQRERWFAKKHDWQWITILYFEDFTAFYEYDEHDDPANMETWNVTGEYGLDRRLRLQASFGDRVPRGWFCTMPEGDITATNVDDPADCVDTLSQHIAPSMPDTRSAPYLNVWDGPVELPN